MSVKQSPHEEYDRGFSNGWDACAARAQPAQAVPVLTDDEINVMWAKQQTKPFKTHAEDRVAFARAIEQAVRAKMGVAVPMTKRVHKSNGGGAVHPALLSTDEWFEFWNTNDNVDGESIFPEFLYLAQDIEQAVLTKVGIVGKEGAHPQPTSSPNDPQAT